MESLGMEALEVLMETEQIGMDERQVNSTFKFKICQFKLTLNKYERKFNFLI